MRARQVDDGLPEVSEIAAIDWTIHMPATTGALLPVAKIVEQPNGRSGTFDANGRSA